MDPDRLTRARALLDEARALLAPDAPPATGEAPRCKCGGPWPCPRQHEGCDGGLDHVCGDGCEPHLRATPPAPPVAPVAAIPREELLQRLNALDREDAIREAKLLGAAVEATRACETGAGDARR